MPRQRTLHERLAEQRQETLQEHHPKKRQGTLRRFRQALVAAVGASLLLTGCGPQYMVLDPVGPVGQEELHLIILSVILTAIVIIPVMILLVFIVWRYRDKPGNKADYKPKWSESKTLEIIWWGVPILIVAVLGVVTAKTTFALVQPPEKSVKPVTIEVTSLDWKWLFQYPDQKIATVNYCEIPTGVPVNFVLTSDAPMNSFWVPQLGGQEYTMPGMAMRLWLQADEPGKYYGHGANFTGKGFAHMDFNVIATPQDSFNTWVSHVKSTAPALTKEGYTQLKKQSVMGTADYSSFPPGLFDDTVWTDGGRYMPGMVSNATNSTMNSAMESSMGSSH